VIRAVLVLAAALACAAALVLPGAASAAPRGFFGVMADDPLLSDPRVDLDREVALMRANGVGAVRLAVYWREMQPLAGGPIDWSSTDRVVAATARRGLRVLPILVRAPGWATGGDLREGAVPNPAAYGAFCAEAVRRYGPRGSFWRERPGLRRLAVRSWQVWNEPDIGRYLSPPEGVSWPRAYVRMLRAANRAIKRADRGATVVAAGLTNRSWIDLRALYRAGARRHFDVAAIHPFSKRVENVVRITELARIEMRKAGDARAKLLLTEISFSSGKGRSTLNYGWEFTERGQAARVGALLPRLAAARERLGLAGVFYYNWLSRDLGDDESFSYSGLRRLSGGGIVAKPALRAFRTAVRRSR
jgi:hypothetical protein